MADPASGGDRGQQQLESEVAGEMDLSVIRYARVWEDHRVLSLALRVAPHDTILSITRQ